jgi:hypothetical protein
MYYTDHTLHISLKSVCGSSTVDHIVIVGGPGNSLDRNHHYSVEKDVNFNAERTTNTNVGLVNLFSRHKPWMNERVRRVNLRLDRALMEHDTSHIGVTGVSCER